MENGLDKIVGPLVDLYKTNAQIGGIIAIALGGFGLLGIVYLFRRTRKTNRSHAIEILFLILFFILSLTAILFGGFGTSNWRQISGSRLYDKPWAVQLETDDTFQEAAGNKKRFDSLYHNLVIFLNRSSDSDKTQFHIFNLYSTEVEADNGAQMAHDNWKTLGYDENYKNSASTKPLNDFCRKFVASDDGKFFICSNE